MRRRHEAWGCPSTVNDRRHRTSCWMDWRTTIISLPVRWLRSHRRPFRSIAFRPTTFPPNMGGHRDFWRTRSRDRAAVSSTAWAIFTWRTTRWMQMAFRKTWRECRAILQKKYNPDILSAGRSWEIAYSSPAHSSTCGAGAFKIHSHSFFRQRTF